MQIGVVANDTRGGVEPYAALAVGLQEAGHEVRLIAPQDYVALTDGAAVRFFGLSGSAEQDARGAAGATERGPIANLRLVASQLGSRIHAWTSETLAASDGVELLTGGVGGMVVGLSVADKLGVPFIPSHLQPVDAPTRAYPGVLLPAVRPNVLGHRLTSLALWTPFAKPMADARREVLGLTGRSTAAVGQPRLYGISPRVLTVPGERNHTVGYWFSRSNAAWHPSAELEHFVAGGGPLVSIGFGSMTSRDAEGATAIVLEAVRSAGARVVLLSGWGGLAGGDLGDDVFVADSVPHEWLFPRMSAVVHHGGAGTTAAALRAGVPSIVVPFTVDQPFWGGRVAALGVGPRPIPRRHLSVERLGAALRVALGDHGMKARAATLGEQIRGEDGVAVAAEALGRFA